MRILRTMLKQTCVYWAPLTLGDEGQVTEFDDPIEVLCRWEDVQVQFIDRMGNPQTSQARVYVGQDVATLGVLWLPPTNRKLIEGEALAQMSVQEQEAPFSNDGAYEIRKFEKLPTLKQRSDDDVLRTVWL